jgi:hypothetical protein
MVLDVVRLRNHESGRTGSCTSSIESISLTVKGCRFVPRDLLSPASEIRSGRSGPGPKPGGSSPTLPFSFGCVRLLVRSRRLPSGGGVRPFRSLLLSLRRGGANPGHVPPRGGLPASRAALLYPGVGRTRRATCSAKRRSRRTRACLTRLAEQLEQPGRNPQHENFSLWQAAENLFQLFHSVGERPSSFLRGSILRPEIGFAGHD